MKFIHTADLHLGKRLRDISLIEDQREVLGQILEHIRTSGAEALLISGDVYDKPSPSGEAMELFDSFLTEAVKLGVRVYVISGNHDNEARVTYLSGLVRDRGIYTQGPFEGKLQSFELEDRWGPLTIHMLPFIKPINVRKFYPDAEIETYEDALRLVLENSPIDKSRRNLLMMHQYISGAATCDSEQLAVGGLDAISSSLFDDFDYVALGHIHGPQYVGRPQVRYSGSPLKYSLSEAEHEKSVTLVELGEKGQVSITPLALKMPHDVREVRGTLDQVMDMEYSEDYVRVTLTDEVIPPDAVVTVNVIFPNMIRFAVDNSKTAEDFDIQEAERLEQKTVPELFSDLYRMQNNGQDPSAEMLGILTDIITKLEDNDK